MRRIQLTILLLFLTGTTTFGSAAAQTPPQKPVPFQEFVSSVAVVDAQAWLARPESRVRTPAAFEEMRRHVLSLYQGVHATHSFWLDSQVFDCIPIAEQPAVRRFGLRKIAPPPPTETPSTGLRSPAGGQPVQSPLEMGEVDAFGNAVSCEKGTIPMRRVTLEELSRFGSLREFFQKGPGGAGRPHPADVPPAFSGQHLYAYAYQYVDNNGGNSWLNLWSPSVGTGQVFSLSQQWYVGGSGSSTQTVEGGWQNYPGKYGTNSSVLFIYWTADNYGSTGCYNLECTAFVQTSSAWTLGGTFPNYSTSGGTQHEFQMQWKHYQGNWWLYLQGTGTLDPLGYYPGSIFGSGQLSQYATLIEYGGETVGNTSWPPMGSGAWANAGSQYAAYQRLIYYTDTSGAGQWGNLTAVQPTPNCYTIVYTPSSSGGSWGSYFYFGGPGGNC
jgi:hypothetical protein